MKTVGFGVLVILWSAAIAMAAGSVSYGRDILMVTSNWAPYYAEDLPENGFFSALVTAAFRAAGHDASVRFMPGARAMIEVQTTGADVLLGVRKSREREKTFLFSDTVCGDDLVFVAGHDFELDTYEGLEDLKGYIIGVGRGFSYREDFDTADFLTKEEATNYTDNVRKLVHGRIDLVVGSKAAILGEIQRGGGHAAFRFKILEPPLLQTDLHIAVSRKLSDGAQIIDDFDRGLAQIRSNGTFKEIQQRFGQENSPDS